MPALAESRAQSWEVYLQLHLVVFKSSKTVTANMYKKSTWLEEVAWQKPLPCSEAQYCDG